MSIDEILVPASNNELHETQKPLSNSWSRIEHEDRAKPQQGSESLRKRGKERWVLALG
jgi:hypothetical protein